MANYTQLIKAVEDVVKSFNELKVMDLNEVGLKGLLTLREALVRLEEEEKILDTLTPQEVNEAVPVAPRRNRRVRARPATGAKKGRPAKTVLPPEPAPTIAVPVVN